MSLLPCLINISGPYSSNRTEWALDIARQITKKKNSVLLITRDRNLVKRLSLCKRSNIFFSCKGYSDLIKLNVKRFQIVITDTLYYDENTPIYDWIEDTLKNKIHINIGYSKETKLTVSVKDKY